MKRILYLSLALACGAATGCHTLPTDGWRYSHPRNTAELYMNGDYVITRRGPHDYVLIFRPPGSYVTVGTFSTLATAKAAAK